MDEVIISSGLRFTHGTLVSHDERSNSFHIENVDMKYIISHLHHAIIFLESNQESSVS